MNILLLGGSGFIGTHILSLLSKKDHFIKVYDIKKPSNICRKKNVSYIEGDLLDIKKLNAELKSTDCVIHLVSTTVPSTAHLNPLYDINTNLISFVKLLYLMVESNVLKIIFLSSGGTVYKSSHFHKGFTEDSLLGPVSSYGIVKLACENYLQMFCTHYGLQPIIFRPSNPYGPGQVNIKGQGIIPTVIENMVLNRPIHVYGNGENIRDYIYIDDLCQLICLAVEDYSPGTYNAGCGHGKSINQIISIFQSLLNLEPNIIYKAARSFDVEYSVLNIDNARNSFNWKPRVSFIDGCKLTASWLIKYMGIKI
jgi:UDP-glucose 4-epimerase